MQIEREISRAQAEGFEQEGSRPIGFDERLGGLGIQSVVDRVSRVTERPSLFYRAYLYQDRDPNAAALADGRIYISSGMIAYLADRGARTDEPFDSASPRSGRNPERKSEDKLAFILGHELAHTVAQHLVRRYRMLQQQELLMALVAAGAAAATRNAEGGAQRAGRLAVDVASMLRDVANSGYSQAQELEADQLGIRYVIRAGFNPQAALDLLEDFERFENPWPFFRTHPYTAQRRADLQRYLEETGQLSSHLTPGRPDGPAPTRAFPPPPAGEPLESRRKRLRDAQHLYPTESVSWKNLQRQLDALN